MKKWITSLALCGALIGASTIVSTTEADAASISASSTNFSSAWGLEKKTSDGAGWLKYGYNTSWINEDYAHGYYKNSRHYSHIQNANGYHTGPDVAAGNISTIEVRHSGNYVNYAMFY